MHVSEIGQDYQSLSRAAILRAFDEEQSIPSFSRPIRALDSAVIMDERLGPIGTERYKEYLRDIHKSGTHVMSLVNDLLDLSKIEAGASILPFSLDIALIPSVQFALPARLVAGPTLQFPGLCASSQSRMPPLLLPSMQ